VIGDAVTVGEVRGDGVIVPAVALVRAGRFVPALPEVVEGLVSKQHLVEPVGEEVSDGQLGDVDLERF